MIKGRKTIALLCGEISDPYTDDFVKGALSAAKEFDVNLVIVPGKYYGNEVSDFKFRYEYQYTSLYSFINEHNVDAAVILTGVIGPFSDDPNSRGYFPKFKAKFEGLPVVSVSTEVEGWSLIKYDNKAAIKEGISYLINEQKCKHIAMVTGDAKSEDAIERLNAYKEALLEEDMELDEKLIVYGNFTMRSKDKIRDLIIQHPNIDAIVFGNDKMAKAGYEVMEELGLTIGRDIAFLGFDDDIDAVRMVPPLASVRADATDLGYEAIKLSYNTCDFNSIKKVVLPNQLIIRESMQKDRMAKDLAEIFRGEPFDIDIHYTSKSLEIYEYLIDRRDNRINHEKLMIKYVELCNSLERLFRLDYITEQDFAEFTDRFFAFNKRASEYDIDATKLIRIFDRIMSYLADSKSDEVSKSIITRATSQIFRKMVEQLDYAAENKYRYNKNIYHNANAITKSMFMFDSGSDQNYSQILSSLPLLNVTNSMLILYDKPMTYLVGDDFKVPAELYVKAVQHYDDVYVPTTRKQKVQLNDLYNACIDLTEETERKDYILLSLFVDEHNYGMIMCDLAYEYFDCCESIVNQGSYAVRMLNMLKKEAETQEQLEHTLELLRQNNIELEELAKKDELTGIYNRRGFFNATQAALDDEGNRDKYALIAYADTDNLKIINDRFGHEGGDFALTSCSNILSQVFNERGMVGRIGGDEFAIFVIVNSVDEQDAYQKKFDDAVTKLNAESDKEYVVKMSIGMTLVKIKEGMDVNDLLEKADALLYKKKKNRRKEILKSEVEN